MYQNLSLTPIKNPGPNEVASQKGYAQNDKNLLSVFVFKIEVT